MPLWLTATFSIYHTSVTYDRSSMHSMPSGMPLGTHQRHSLASGAVLLGNTFKIWSFIPVVHHDLPGYF